MAHYIPTPEELDAHERGYADQYTDVELAERLRMIAVGTSSFKPAARKAILLEASRRLAGSYPLAH